MTAPFVVAGGPVRNRAWVLPRHLEAVRWNNPQVMFYLVNDSTDNTEKFFTHESEFTTQGENGEVTPPRLLSQWPWTGPGDRPNRYMGVEYEYFRYDTGEPGYTRDGSDGPRYSSKNMAFLRNLWAEEALRRWPQATHLWVVDSDVLPEPDVLEKLLELQAPVAAAYVPVGDGFPIAMCGGGAGSMPYRLGDERFRKDPHVATCVGGCYLVERRVFETGHGPWSEHPIGEDGGFANHCLGNGFVMLHHPGARCQHIMERDNGNEWDARSADALLAERRGK